MGLKVANNLISAYRNSTNRQAQSVWKAFQSWLPPTVQKITVKELMEFLIFCEQEKRLDPRTILNYRSQLRLPMLHAFNIN